MVRTDNEFISENFGGTIPFVVLVQAKDKGLDFSHSAGLKIVDKEPNKTIKFTGNDKIPFEFFVWIQLKMVAPYDTRLKITLKAKLNMMMKMMVGKKLQSGIDSMADQIAAAFNGKI